MRDGERENKWEEDREIRKWMVYGRKRLRTGHPVNRYEDLALSGAFCPYPSNIQPLGSTLVIQEEQRQKLVRNKSDTQTHTMHLYYCWD